VFLELFELFLRYGGYPHQQVSFGFSILIWGRAKSAAPGGGKAEVGGLGALAGEKVPVTGDPDRVVKEVGPQLLDRSSSSMMEEVGSGLALDAEYLERAGRPLVTRLAMTGAELFARDATSRRLFAPLEGRRIADTRLREYFGKDERKSVADWTRTVKERVKKAFLDPSTRERTPLPRL
jgi:hypothetical protein